MLNLHIINLILFRAKVTSFNVTVIKYLLLICYNLVNFKVKSLNIKEKNEADLMVSLAGKRTH
jgi:hypothetical protein